ncbi:MAG: hypothetical protein JNL41_07465 [Phenylobacterium sp.]|uniref:hypothetical protein n=1 Tax=Phenylobacterium sp. TaxID=1871053 RepID=UPI001A4C4CA5|nr:hypothetical protein [Phenylobacterium sp.]MBL8554100.1 hypothetical protein [Phenylobacterium sp.]
MRKFIASALAALTFGGAVLATAAPAQADSRHRYYDRHHHSRGGNTAATAAIAGIAGLAIGAAIADGNRGRSSSYYSGGYSRGYDNGYRYDPRYDGYYGDYYDRGPRTCVVRERVWDPYIRRNVMIERSYRC